VPLSILTGDRLREVEVSITARCTLACRECGFLVPDQPAPARGEPVSEHTAALDQLRRLGVRIGSLAVVGGEPTFDGALLERAVRAFRGTGAADRIEVVSNGLTPRGVTVGTLAAIDRFTISDYGLDDALLDGWRRWIARLAPHVEICIRHSREGWDAWTEERRVPPARAQAMFDTCWYRRHCVTLERGRLFACSRIAKLARDDEGLPLTSATTSAEIEAYLHRPEALPSCATCTPMMGLPTVPAGVQPDDRLARLQRRAVAWLDEDLRRLEEA
jgi:hypothetical protein